MSGHTPGPWEVIQGHYPSFKEVQGPSFKISCVMWATDLTEDDYEKRSADLRLIAAAPELLEALQELLPTLEDQRIDAKARAAIAKATGGQP